jgi:hypothetical protein
MFLPEFTDFCGYFCSVRIKHIMLFKMDESWKFLRERRHTLTLLSGAENGSQIMRVWIHGLYDVLGHLIHGEKTDWVPE